ncbi:hypothetical protein ACIPSJ_27360 [Streptomyces sp. NPDC090088]|uniref:hypothetical protein n=1 Tax=Streptomyces sp. NPDC090088 TaxID=3365944 RepID=UPI00380AD1E7
MVAWLEEIERREAASRERIEDGNIGVRAKLYTSGQYDDVKQRDALFTQLQEAGIVVRGDVTTDQFRAILAIMQPDA